MAYPPHNLDALLKSYEDSVGPLPYGIAAFRPWYEHKLTAYCRCFGVTFDDTEVAAEKRDTLVALKVVLRQVVELPYPTKGALEGSLVYAQCPQEFDVFFQRLHELKVFYRATARELAMDLWGALGERTSAQLKAAVLIAHEGVELEDAHKARQRRGQSFRRMPDGVGHCDGSSTHLNLRRAKDVSQPQLRQVLTCLTSPRIDEKG
jgi:hypothetical protein